MKFMAAREFRIRGKKVWSDLRKAGRVVITSNGQPVAMMLPVDGDTLDGMSRAFDRVTGLENLRRMQERAQAAGLHYTMDEIDEIIAETRRERKARPA